MHAKFNLIESVCDLLFDSQNVSTEDVILPVESLVALEIAVPIGKVEEAERGREEDSRDRVDFGRAVRRAAFRRLFLSLTSVVLIGEKAVNELPPSRRLRLYRR